MSTRGSFILRKDGLDKEVIIHFDAYPSHAGAEVVALVKTTDLNLLYELLVSEGWDDAANSTIEPAVFSYEELLWSIRHHKRLSIDHHVSFIRDSLFCEYAYVIDLDEEELLFYEGFKKSPQEGNPYGTAPTEGANGTRYYPCHVKARFSIGYVRAANAEDIVSLMEQSRNLDASEVATYASQDSAPSPHGTNTHDDEGSAMVSALLSHVERLCQAARVIDGSFIPTQQQADILHRRIAQLGDSIDDLEKGLALLP